MMPRSPAPDQAQQLPQSATRLVIWIARHWLLLFNLAWGSYVFTPLLAPIFMQLGWQVPARTIYALYSPFCHQLPDHSYFLFGRTLVPLAPVFEAAGIAVDVNPLLFRRVIGDSELGYKVALCQRDLAIYGSVLSSGLLYGFLRKQRHVQPLRLWIYALLVVPMAIDGVMQLLGLHESSWLLRTLSGAIFGAASVWLAYPYVDQAMRDVVATEERKPTI